MSVSSAIPLNSNTRTTRVRTATFLLLLGLFLNASQSWFTYDAPHVFSHSSDALMPLADQARAEIGVATRGVSRALPFSDDVMRANVNQALDDIAAGTKNYPQDFSTFFNREGLLPKQAAGYYREFTVQPPPGVAGRGVWRIVFGEGGEFYFTPTHYESFVRIPGP